MDRKFLAKAMIVVLFAAVVGFSLDKFLINNAKAQGISGVPFSGNIVAYIPPTLVCPVAHTLIFDYQTLSILGIAVTPGSEVYSFGNLFTSGAYVLGTHRGAPIPCLLPYPIMPISQVGTSAY